MTDRLLTVVTPYAPFHAHLLERAEASVKAQTIPVDFIAVRDDAYRGPGTARNAGIRAAKTPFVTFLDADDWLEPDFAEKTVSAWRPGFYVYVWTHMHYGRDTVRINRYAANCVISWRCHHSVTAVVRTSTAAAVGFSETRTGSEDSHFWRRVASHGVCPLRVPEALFHYERADGVRHHWADDKGYWRKVFDTLFEEVPVMACCGNSPGVAQKPQPKYDTDILVTCQWRGNRRHVGRATGRVYDRSGNGKQVYIDPHDAALAPELYKVVKVENAPDPVIEEPLPIDIPAEIEAQRGDEQPETVRLSTDEAETTSAGEYENMTRTELLELAKERGLNPTSRMNKDALVHIHTLADTWPQDVTDAT